MHAIAHDNHYDDKIATYAFRQHVKPGITGLWQVTERNSASFDGMVRRDLEYIAKRGIVMDLKIVLLTALEVFNGSDAY